MVKLPLEIELKSINFSLQALSNGDFDFYQSVYSDPTLMKHINDQIDAQLIRNNFDVLISESAKDFPMFINYIVSHEEQQVGFFGVKLHAEGGMEIGLILIKSKQGLGWANIINRAFMSYATDQCDMDHFIAYCKHDNAAANHVFESLAFQNVKQFINQKKQHLMNKWVFQVNSKNGHNI